MLGQGTHREQDEDKPAKHGGEDGHHRLARPELAVRDEEGVRLVPLPRALHRDAIFVDRVHRDEPEQDHDDL
jgi:hypothetical protein